ncbi:ferric reductase [Sphaerisporangium rufum]|uniref:Ferric reductase n=1 Tax=Sphaerisporangium rufum TaxID=1381558 RepID=A0A919R5E6_9ACTN|nr:ferredoxin reductase family protein [Sphaerisporangium rufum]GII78625.1 ferric reductase [Sphaerisporangium rufum]
MSTTYADRRSATVTPARTSGPPGVGPHGAAVLVPSLVTAGAAAVLALWWRDTAAVTGLGGWLTGAGRITGLLAGYAIAVLLVLMARIPALERSAGADRLTRWHAMGGRYTVGLAVAHTLLIIWGYAVTERAGVVDETVTLVLTYPDVLKATVAVLLLVGVGAVSARAARPRLRYETWFYLHFYTYLAAFLAFGHQVATGEQFAGDPVARAAWYGLYLAVAAVLVWFRFLVPARLALRHRLRVAEVVQEAPGVVSVYLAGRRLDGLRAEAGQFFRWRFLTRDRWWAANPYSLSAPPDGDRLRITVKDLGDHSRSLAGLRPGTQVVAEGPYGAFTARRAAGRRKVLMIAGGVGITPIRALFETVPGQVTLLYRASEPAGVVFHHELAGIAARRGATLRYLVGSRAAYGDPFTPETLARLVPDLREHTVYVCGPAGMARAAIAALRAAGVPRRRVHHESFEF